MDRELPDADLAQRHRGGADDAVRGLEALAVAEPLCVEADAPGVVRRQHDGARAGVDEEQDRGAVDRGLQEEMAVAVGVDDHLVPARDFGALAGRVERDGLGVGVEGRPGDGDGLVAVAEAGDEEQAGRAVDGGHQQRPSEHRPIHPLGLEPTGGPEYRAPRLRPA